MSWHGTKFRAMHPPAEWCYHVEAAVTDRNGKYSTPSWSSPSNGAMIWTYSKNTRFEAFKPGYVQSSETSSVPIRLERYQGTRELYFSYLRHVTANFCGVADGSEANLADLLDEISAEAKSIAATSEEVEIAESIGRSGTEIRRRASERASSRSTLSK